MPSATGTFRHLQTPLNMGGAIVNTRQYVAVEIDQFSNFLVGRFDSIKNLSSRTLFTP
jgi:hypothetical protein